jgi:hypothetical protein
MRALKRQRFKAFLKQNGAHRLVDALHSVFFPLTLMSVQRMMHVCERNGMKSLNTVYANRFQKPVVNRDSPH